MKITFVYGYAEGPRLVTKFNKVAAKLGHDLVDVDQADVVIAHSGGTFMVPTNTSKVVLLVNAPHYDSHWSFVKKLTTRVADEGFHLNALRKLLWNTWYFLSQPVRGRQMKKAVIAGHFTGLDGKIVIMVRNEHDNFGTIEQDNQIAKKFGWLTQELPGTHDDVWSHPEAYIKLAERYL